ncbi:MAG: glycosyltransferase [Bacteroidales bacterium]|nr:glycosyltransferase [Bacteroidales bacterium]
MNSSDNSQISKRILLVSLSPFLYGTGANSNFLTNFSIGVRLSGYFIELLIQDQSINDAGEFQGVQYKGCGGYRTRFKFINSLSRIFANIFFPSYHLFKKKNSIDCVLAFQNNFLYNVFLLITCKLLSKPFIYIQVDHYNFASYNTSRIGFRKRIKYLNYKLRYNFLSRYISGAIVLSHFLKEHYLSLGIREENIFLNPHLVNVDIFSEALNTQIFTNETISFGVLGSINQRNGIVDLLIAFKFVTERYDKVELILIGGSEQEFDFCRKKSKELMIPDKIRYIAPVHYTKLPEVMKKCDAFVLPRPASIEAIAGFPTKVGEIMSCKRPIIITSFGDIPIYFEDKNNALLTNPGDPKSIASKMLYVIENQNECLQIAQNGYNWIINTIEYKAAGKKIGEYLSKFIQN